MADDNDEISSDSENPFIDDQKIGNEADFYRFQNVENDIEQVLADAEKQALVELISLMNYRIYVMFLMMKV